MKRILFLFISLFLAQLTVAQSTNTDLSIPKIIPPAPDAAALALYSYIPVSYSTGVPDISIPIYELKAGKLSVPIGISYHASGNKVRDIASVVGLGWALNAGGTISRTVLGRTDEANDNRSPYKTTDDIINARGAVQNNSDAFNLIYQLQNMSKQSFETQSDRYSYSFGGRSGTFRFDWINGNTHFIPYAPLKLNKAFLNNDNRHVNLYYTITDENGNTYEFAAKEMSNQSGQMAFTGWNLTKIISADQKDDVNFFYSTGETVIE